MGPEYYWSYKILDSEYTLDIIVNHSGDNFCNIVLHPGEKRFIYEYDSGRIWKHYSYSNTMSNIYIGKDIEGWDVYVYDEVEDIDDLLPIIDKSMIKKIVDDYRIESLLR